MDILDSAYVQAAGGLDGDQQLGVFIDLARNDGFLLVAAGHAAGNRCGALAAAHVILLNQSGGIGLHGGAFDKTVLLKFRLPITLQNKVVCQRKVQHQAVLVAILRNVAHAQLGALTNGGACDILPFQGDGTGGGFFKTGQTINQLGLAVPLDAGNADDLPGAHLKIHALDGVVLVCLAGHHKTLDVQNDLARLAGLFLNGKIDIAPDHHTGQLLLGGIGNIYGADIAALLQNGAAVGNGHDFVQLVGDEQDALALGLETAHDLHQFVDFLRRKDGGRLIKNQNLIVAVQHFKDFDTLLHTDGNVADQCVGIYAQTVLFAQGHDLFARSIFFEETELGILDTQNDVVQNGKTFHQLEVLMHHADAQRGGLVRVGDFYLFAVLFDDALFGLVHAEQYAHQGGFTGTVFAQQCMDLTLSQLQGDIVVSLDARKFLGDVQHLDDIILCQSLYAPFL